MYSRVDGIIFPLQLLNKSFEIFTEKKYIKE